MPFIVKCLANQNAADRNQRLYRNQQLNSRLLSVGWIQVVCTNFLAAHYFRVIPPSGGCWNWKIEKLKKKESKKEGESERANNNDK